MEQILFKIDIVEDQKQYQTQEEIELNEARKKAKKLQEDSNKEFALFFITKGINTIWEQSNATGIEQFIEDNKEDPQFKLLKEIFDKVGGVATIKFINNQYLKYCEGCSIPGFKNRVKESRKHREYYWKLKIQSKKDIEKEAEIDEQIIKFKIKNQQ